MDSNIFNKNFLQNSFLYVEGDIKIGDQNIFQDLQYTESSLIPIPKIKQQLKEASYFLANYRNHFEHLPDSHIDRKETGILFEWTNKPVIGIDKPIAMLVGDAGFGKSVILKDLLRELQDNNIPTLGIKVDYFYVENLDKLNTDLGLEDSLIKMVSSLADKEEQVVVILDQVDALSLSFSASRKYLKTYKLLVEKLLNLPNVKVVLSVRTYDLATDRELNFFDDSVRNPEHWKNQLIVKVEKLTLDEVSKVLQMLDSKMPRLTDNLIELLRTPLHLDVFAKVYKKNINLKTLKTLQDLYCELWEDKILKKTELTKSQADRQRCKKLLYQMVEKVEISTLEEDLLKDDYLAELKYLKSEGILKLEKGKIQFFHQTFFDYVFARKFVETESSVSRFLKKHRQGLSIRASLKMIINYLRVRDEKRYLKEMKKLTAKPSTRFHIKYLLISLLGYRDAPTQKEIDFAFNHLLSNQEFHRIFLEVALGKNWLGLFIERGILDDLICTGIKWKPDQLTAEEYFQNNQQLWLSLLARKLPEERAIILPYLNRCPEFNKKSKSIWYLLSQLKVWDLPLAKELFRRHEIHAKNDHFWFLNILGDATKYDFDWVVEIYRPYLLEAISELNFPKHTKINFTHDDVRLIRKLFKIDAEQAFVFYLDMLNRIIEKTSEKKLKREDQLYGDWAHSFHDFSRNSTLDNGDEITKNLINQIEIFAREEHSIFKKFIQKYHSSSSTTILILLVFGLKANPKVYTDDIIAFLLYFQRKNGFRTSGNLAYFVRRLLHESYAVFNENQKQQINQLLLNLTFKEESFVHETNEDKKVLVKNYGRLQYQYLKAIPEDKLKKQAQLKQRFLELQRKFGKVNDKKPNSLTIRGVHPPISKEACGKMTFEQWEQSFLKYNKEYKSEWDSYTGGIFDHARVFGEQVKGDPDKFFLFIKKLVKENIVSLDYIIAGLQGLKEGKYHDAIAFLNLFERTLTIELTGIAIHELIRITDYFIEAKKISKTILDFLIYNSLNGLTPKDDLLHSNEKEADYVDNIYYYGLDSVRGRAAHSLCCINFEPDFEHIIFDTLFKIAEDDLIKVRVCLISNLKRILNLNRDKTFQLFLKLVASNHPAIYYHAFKVVKDLAYDKFEVLIPFLEKAIQFEDTHEKLCTILTHAWAKKTPKSEILFMKLVNKSFIARSILPEIAAHNLYLESESIDPKTEQLFRWNFDTGDKELQDSYAKAFWNLKPEDFPKILHLLQEYATSKAGKRHLHSYYDYLTKCSAKYPKECLDLLQHFDAYNKDERFERATFHEDEPLKVVMGAYNNLDSEKKEDQKYIEIAMKLFDKMLKSSLFRQYAEKILVQVEI